MPPERGEDMDIKQLVLPKECRRTVLELVHDIPLADHLGKEKAMSAEEILLANSVFKDVKEFC